MTLQFNEYLRMHGRSAIGYNTAASRILRYCRHLCKWA